MIVLGIVGTPAGGKSTVAGKLKELGAAWINADRIAQSMLDRTDVIERLVQRLGETILDQDRRIDRSALAGLVFGDDDTKRQALRYLESVVHPPTRTEITERLRRAASHRFPVAVLDVPLLFESHWDVCCDEIWSIDAPRTQRLQRVLDRGWDEQELVRRESNQLPISEKNRLSNYQLMNDSTRGALHWRVERRWNRLMCYSVERRPYYSSTPHCLTDLARDDRT
jgi:dephospho-CoA kinase